jgi:excisionase family DNA binding protein
MIRARNEVFTTKEACYYLRISRPTFLKLIYSNQIRAKKIGKGWKVLRSEIEAYLRGEDDEPRSNQSKPRGDLVDDQALGSGNHSP